MILRLPISTLFPYTTLFRSLFSQKNIERYRRMLANPRDGAQHRIILKLLAEEEATLKEPQTKDNDVYRLERDRKSTRLNSSHTVISYAVFCLKKKKKTKIIR